MRLVKNLFISLVIAIAVFIVLALILSMIGLRGSTVGILTVIFSLIIGSLYTINDLIKKGELLKFANGVDATLLQKEQTFFNMLMDIYKVNFNKNADSEQSIKCLNIIKDYSKDIDKINNDRDIYKTVYNFFIDSETYFSKTDKINELYDGVSTNSFLIESIENGKIYDFYKVIEKFKKGNLNKGFTYEIIPLYYFDKLIYKDYIFPTEDKQFIENCKEIDKLSKSLIDSLAEIEGIKIDEQKLNDKSKRLYGDFPTINSIIIDLIKKNNITQAIAYHNEIDEKSISKKSKYFLLSYFLSDEGLVLGRTDIYKKSITNLSKIKNNNKIKLFNIVFENTLDYICLEADKKNSNDDNISIIWLYTFEMLTYSDVEIDDTLENITLVIKNFDEINKVLVVPTTKEYAVIQMARRKNNSKTIRDNLKKYTVDKASLYVYLYNDDLDAVSKFIEELIAEEEAMEAYKNSPEFKKRVILDKIKTLNSSLSNTKSRQAHVRSQGRSTQIEDISIAKIEAEISNLNSELLALR